MSAAVGSPVRATVGVTGLSATDNPAPGVAVARALRAAPAFAGRIIGLGYDALDPGFYADGLFDGGSILPYPAAGRDALWDHLMRVKESLGLDVFVPTLDSELRAAVALEERLRDAGVATYLPSPAAIERASKPQLPRLAGGLIHVPESEALTTPDALPRLLKEYGLPAVVKGVYYGARVVHSEGDALAAFHYFAATWGLPVVVQRFIAGEEYNVAAVGDGAGGTVGAVAMRKLTLTDKGKGWSGVTVDNPDLLRLAEAVIGALRWRGGLEVEVLKEAGGDGLHVIEINPRFPAWIYLSAGAGQNLPEALVRLALGLPVARPLPAYRVGTLFVRIALDQIATLDRFAQLSATGTLLSEVTP